MGDQGGFEVGFVLGPPLLPSDETWEGRMALNAASRRLVAEAEAVLRAEAEDGVDHD